MKVETELPVQFTPIGGGGDAVVDDFDDDLK